MVNESKVNRGREDNPWALYDLSKDRCEMIDLCGDMPDKCSEMQQLWHKYENEYRTKPNQ